MLGVQCFLPLVGTGRWAVSETQRSVGVSEFRGHFGGRGAPLEISQPSKMGEGLGRSEAASCAMTLPWGSVSLVQYVPTTNRTTMNHCL
jgi:hypothetical protein